MTVVRFTFDVCLRKSTPGDVYTMGRKLEEALTKCEYVCGCEVKSSHTLLANSVDIDKAIAEQNDKIGRSDNAVLSVK